MSTITASEVDARTFVLPLRGACAAAAVAVLIDAGSVGAPGLGLLAVPFLIAAVGLRVGRTLTCIGLSIWSLVYVGIGINFAVANGFDAPWGDIVGVYVGAALAAAVAGLSIVRIIRRDGGA